MQAPQRETSAWPPLYDQLMSDWAQGIGQVIAAMSAIPDPEARARAATELLNELSKADGIVSKMRREDIKALREAGMSYRQIGDAIGVHFSRVRQIESGKPTGTSSRSRAAKEVPGETG